MKTDWTHLEPFRNTKGHMASDEGEHQGVFYLRRGPTEFIVIASCGDDHEIRWEHVSAQARDFKGGRTPTWAEMCWLKDLFWDEEECVVQYHPPKSDYVNNHPNVLHLWRPLDVEIPRPPSICVGIK